MEKTNNMENFAKVRKVLNVSNITARRGVGVFLCYSYVAFEL